MIDLADLRLPPSLAEQLHWYWCAAERELGLKSNFEAVIQASLTTRNKGSKPVSNSKPASYTGAQLEDASDVRWIEGVLARVGRTHRRTLSAVYGPGLPEEAARTWRWLRHHDLPMPVLLWLRHRNGVLVMAREAAEARLARVTEAAQAVIDLAEVSTSRDWNDAVSALDAALETP